jgi:hypothetical protein
MKTRHSAEQIVLLLREADVELGKGVKAREICRKHGKHLADVLPLATRARLDESEVCQATAGIAQGECQAEAAGCRTGLELRNRKLFLDLAEAKVTLDLWRIEYKEQRPYGSLGWQTPAARPI